MHFSPMTDRLAGTGSVQWALHQRARALGAEGADIIELTIGEPDQPPDPRLLDACNAAMRAGRTRYSSGRGEPGLLAALARRYARRRAGVEERNILCFPGTQTALFATLMGLAGEGDGILTGNPFYATYEGLIAATGGTRVSVPLRPEHGFRLQASDLEAAITPACRVLLLNTPHNPTGAISTPSELSAIGAVCKRHDLWIVCDEVYENMVFEGAFASPFDDPALSDRVIAVSSISKSFAAPGFRSGWAVGPAGFCDRILPLSETMLFGNQPFIADMTAWALEADLPTARSMREDYRRRAALITERLGAIQGLHPFPPKAGMFIIVDVTATGLDDETFAWRLLDEGVAVMPGSSFGDGAAGMIRLSLTVPDVSIEEACQRIAGFVGALS